MFNKEKFMEEELERLASSLGVSVEFLKSKEFDEWMDAKNREDAEKEIELEKYALKKTRRTISSWGLFWAVASISVYGLLSNGPFWHSVVACVITFCAFVCSALVAVDIVKRSDYTTAEYYWHAVEKIVQTFVGAVFVTAFFILIFLFAATR
jgi:hypothetical protein